MYAYVRKVVTLWNIKYDYEQTTIQKHAHAPCSDFFACRMLRR